MSKPIEVNVSVNGIIIQDGKILLLRINRPAHKKGKWGLPGGKVSSGETFEDTLIREIEEETGISQDQYTFQKFKIIHEIPTSSCKHIYFITLTQIIDHIHFDEDEIIEAKWEKLEKEQLQKYDYRAPWILPLIDEVIKVLST